jgi:hypothetical protein
MKKSNKVIAGLIIVSVQSVVSAAKMLLSEIDIIQYLLMIAIKPR